MSTGPMALDEQTSGRIRAEYAQLSRTEQKIADYLLGQAPRGQIFSISDLALETGVSEATLVRFSKRLGYTGFLDFKKAFFGERLVSARQAAPPPYEELTETDEPPIVLRKVFALMHESLESSLRRIDQESFTRAVACMAEADLIEFWAHGGSNHIAQNAAITYLRFGLRCTVYDPLLHAGAIEQTSPRDVVVGVSHTGMTEGVIRAVARARERGIRTVCLTNTPGSPLASAAEVVLLTSVSSPRPISDVGVSRVAQAAVLDALGVAVVQYLKRRKETGPGRLDREV